MAWTKAHTTIKPVARRYGRLRVLRRVPDVNNLAVMYACRCDCGARVVVAGGSLRHGSTQSCGCLRLELARTRQRKRPYEALYNFLVNAARHHGRKVLFSYEWFNAFIEQHPRCFYCNKAIPRPQYFSHAGRSGIYGLDRLSNAKDYTAENVVSCCSSCNYRRQQLGYTSEEFKAYL